MHATQDELQNSPDKPYQTLSQRLDERHAQFHFNKYGGKHFYGCHELEGLFGSIDSRIWDEVWDTHRWERRVDYVEEAAKMVRAQERDEQKQGVHVRPLWCLKECGNEY